MRARISNIGTQFGEPLESVQVEKRENFHEWVRAQIGPTPGQGEEIFDFLVCSPEWVNEECRRTGYFMARRVLIVPQWDPDLVKKAIEYVVSLVTADTWQEIASTLSSIASWEFEDYQDVGNTGASA